MAEVLYIGVTTGAHYLFNSGTANNTLPAALVDLPESGTYNSETVVLTVTSGDIRRGSKGSVASTDPDQYASGYTASPWESA